MFLAVIEGDTVRDKQVFPIHVVFPPNVDRLTLTSPGIAMALPVTKDVSGASYGVTAGFQLSADELAANRRDPVARCKVFLNELANCPYCSHPCRLIEDKRLRKQNQASSRKPVKKLNGFCRRISG